MNPTRDAASQTFDAGTRAERPAAAASSFVQALRAPGPVRAVELRPPRADLAPAKSVDAWIEADHSVRRLLADERFVLYTDDAVGSEEEESLRLLTSALGPRAPLERIVPFLTCKHTLSYCMLFARRAASFGFDAVTVTGGDPHVGPPRCVPRSRQLRARIRGATPQLSLGTWVNPFADPDQQVSYLLDPKLEADYYLTQVVSHHTIERVDALLEAAEKAEAGIPGMFGVFYFRSGRVRTLERLAQFFPVPLEGLRREFEEGVPPEEVCARTIRTLRDRGIENVYVCNLGSRGPAQRLREIEARL